jgi:hypothetical protein
MLNPLFGQTKMKKYNRHFFLFMLLLVVRPALASCFFYPDGEINEKIFLFTDRTLYIAGEKVHFSATLFNSNDTVTANQSRILYCELITPDGIIVTNNKFLIHTLSAEGCIIIPDHQLTGTYYLRAYTKMMRQRGPQYYEYKQIRIINPRKPDVLVLENNQDLLARQFIQTEQKGGNDLLTVSVEKELYAARDTISLFYKEINGSSAKIKSLCLSVVPEYSKTPSTFYAAEKIQFQAETEFFPETRGLSIAGKLTEASSAIPIPDKRINLSIIGEGRDFMATLTDSTGRFFFALPDYTGSRDLFLCAEKMPAKSLKIWVDNDFCTTPFRMPSPDFTLNEQERRTAQNMAQNMQINSHFRNLIIPDSVDKNTDVLSFYGKPTTVLYLDKYIQLPTLEEYFNELPSQVKVRKRKGESYFAVQATNDLSFYDPLVLVDWVAVDEPAKILAVSPLNISRIEVVNEDYVKGGQTYGGIISIISKKGDFAGIDLPSTGIFINYRFLAENQCYEKDNEFLTTHPDARNTILWKPSLNSPKNQPEKIILIAPDTPGKYSVTFEGITIDGKFFSISSGFEVESRKR